MTTALPALPALLILPDLDGNPVHYREHVPHEHQGLWYHPAKGLHWCVDARARLMWRVHPYVHQGIGYLTLIPKGARISFEDVRPGEWAEREEAGYAD